jgi:hypothetical protein
MLISFNIFEKDEKSKPHPPQLLPLSENYECF